MLFKSLSSEKEKIKNEKKDNKINEIKDEPFFVYQGPEKDEYLNIESDDFIKERLSLISFKRGGEIINHKKIRPDIIYMKKLIVCMKIILQNIILI